MTENLDDEDCSDMRNQFRWSLQALASDAEAQKRLFPDFVCKADELALDYDHRSELARSLPGPEYSGGQLEALEGVDRRLSSMSRGGVDFEEELWSEEALTDRLEWEQVRSLAKLALDRLGWPSDAPPWGRSLYVSGGPDLA